MAGIKNYSTRFLFQFALLLILCCTPFWIEGEPIELNWYSDAQIAEVIAGLSDDQITVDNNYYGLMAQINGEYALILRQAPDDVVPQLTTALKDSTRYKTAHFLLKAMLIDGMSGATHPIPNRYLFVYGNDGPDIENHSEVRTWWIEKLEELNSD